jgi:glycosyltransferase involved in cell wall biosynthesis
VSDNATALVSVITPCFNAAPFLAETIQSCQAQTHQNFELLVVDDGSTDTTATIAEQMSKSDGRIHVFRESHRGTSAARNTALANAHGAFIALLDSDDCWMPDFLEQQLRTLRLNPAADIVTANALNIGGPFDGKPYWPASNQQRLLTMEEMILRENAVHIFSVFHRSVVDRVGGFDSAFPRNEDYHLWLRAAAAGCRFIADYTPRGYYRRHGDSMSANEERMLKGILAVLQDIRSICKNGSPEERAVDSQIARFRRQLLVGEAREYISSGEPRNAIESLKQIAEHERGYVLSALLRVARVWPSALSYSYRTKRAYRQMRAR